MELKKGMTFTGTNGSFDGRVEVLSIDEPNNVLRVGMSNKHETFNSNWNEDWNLQHTIWGFERGDYFEKTFTDYPQDLQEMKRIAVPHGSAHVSKDCSQDTIDALNKLAVAAYETADSMRTFGKAVEENIYEDYLEDTALEDCPNCGRTYDDADFDFQICSFCGWDVDEQKTRS